MLALAAEQDRILVSRNWSDFAPLLGEWAEAGRHHAGCILVWTLAHTLVGAITSAVNRLLQELPDPDQWRDLARTTVPIPAQRQRSERPMPFGGSEPL